MVARAHIHGTALVLGGQGVLIVGASGAGKSLLALQLLDRAKVENQPAALISDDLVFLDPGKNGLTLQAPDRLHGKIELRGAGIVSRPFQQSAPLKLVVEFVDQTERLPEIDQLFGMVEGVSVTRRALMPFPKMAIEQQVLIVRDALGLG